ncbi:MAG: hypothetical protein ABFD89_03660 [Bryobacteraceae bacterium]
MDQIKKNAISIIIMLCQALVGVLWYTAQQKMSQVADQFKSIEAANVKTDARIARLEDHDSQQPTIDETKKIWLALESGKDSRVVMQANLQILMREWPELQKKADALLQSNAELKATLDAVQKQLNRHMDAKASVSMR